MARTEPPASKNNWGILQDHRNSRWQLLAGMKTPLVAEVSPKTLAAVIVCRNGSTSARVDWSTTIWGGIEAGTRWSSREIDGELLAITAHTSPCLREPAIEVKLKLHF